MDVVVPSLRAARATPVNARAGRARLRWLLWPLVALFARPLRVHGSVPAGPVVFAANHASHADTPVLLRGLARHGIDAAPAAAADYWFAGRVRSWIARNVVGAFPFPRHGREGLVRAEQLLAQGRSVVLFPEGTRSRDGSVSRFRGGVGVLAARGWTIVPVAIAGTREVFPKGARVPRRAPVVVRFGEPIRVETADADVRATASVVEQRVRALHGSLTLPTASAPRATAWYRRANASARSRAALALVFCWAVAEALWLPIVPDVPVALLALAAPSRVLLLVAAALAGTTAGGALAAVAGPSLLAHAPLVTDRMAEQAAAWLATEGAGAVAHQPWSGVPFKAFALQLPADVGLGSFLGETALARGARFAQVGAAFAVAGVLFRPIVRRTYALLVPLALAAFAIGLSRVVEAWS